MSVSEASENHGTEAMDNLRSHSNSTSKPEEERHQRSTTVSDAPKAETGVLVITLPLTFGHCLYHPLHLDLSWQRKYHVSLYLPRARSRFFTRITPTAHALDHTIPSFVH